MTLEEKIGQMTQPNRIRFLKIRETCRNISSALYSAAAIRIPPKETAWKAWTDLYDKVQEEAIKTRLSIPVLYGIDAVHGHSNVLAPVIFPHNIALGCTRDADLIERLDVSPRKRCGQPGYSGHSDRALQFPRISAGAEPTKDSQKIRRLSAAPARSGRLRCERVQRLARACRSAALNVTRASSSTSACRSPRDFRLHLDRVLAAVHARAHGRGTRSRRHRRPRPAGRPALGAGANGTACPTPRG